MPLGGRPHERKPEAGARAVGSRPRQKRSNTCSASSPRTPSPSSVTVSRATPFDAPVSTTIRPRPWRRAFSTRFASARSSAARSPRTVTGPARRPPLRPPGATSSSRTGSSGGGGRLLAGEREQVVRELRDALGCRARARRPARRSRRDARGTRCCRAARSAACAARAMHRRGSVARCRATARAPRACR